jgi:hypothetical protein
MFALFNVTVVVILATGNTFPGMNGTKEPVGGNAFINMIRTQGGGALLTSIPVFYTKELITLGAAGPAILANLGITDWTDRQRML